ncbi:MAG: hypothetical protein ACI9HK_000524 [Pirellulaceae bacterium]|jgi:hypothetical protein
MDESSNQLNMTADELEKKVKLHNVIQSVVSLGLIPISFVLWYLSYLFFRITFYFVLSLFVDDAWHHSFYVAMLCLVPLAVEGFRQTRPLFDSASYMESDLYDNFITETETGSALNWYFGNPTGAAFMITQFLYCAPRSMILSIRAWQDRVMVSGEAYEQAAFILNELRTVRKWIPAERYENNGAALSVLYQLKLIWFNDKDGPMVRYPAGQD